MLRHLLLIAFATVLGQANAQSPGEAACNYIKGYASICAQGYSNFAQLPFTIAASCLCYEPTAWNPDNYDQAFKTCGNYIRTASPDAFLTLTSVGGPLPTAPCRDAGNVRNYPEKDVRLLACQQIQNVFAGCAQTYPGFMTAAPFLQQSPCLCYRDGNPNAYVGDVYDSKASECLDYLETANAQGYASAVAANGGKWVPPCQSALDAKTSRSIPGPASSTTPPRPADSPSPVVVVSTTTRPPTTLSTTTQPPAPIVESPSTPEPLPSTESIKEPTSISKVAGFTLSSSTSIGFLIPGIASTQSANGGVTTRTTARPFVPVPTSVSAGDSVTAKSLWLQALGIVVALIV